MQHSLFSPPAEPVQGVSRVVGYIRRIVAENKTLKSLRVRGEISDLKNVNGRLYFDLKENADVLKCVVWSEDAAKLPPFKDGDDAVCGGDYGTWPARSQYQLAVKTLELSGGVGALYAEFEKLKERFRKEGLFEQSRKRPMPPFPTRVAVISAPGGRGVEDFFTTMSQRAPHVDLRVIETRMQGDGAQIDVGEAIDKASKMDVDVIVLTRGGGSYEDLFPFNLEPVVRAIVRARHPVLTAIGHTADKHLSDYVADLSCETPSNAAHFFGGIRDRYVSAVQHLSQRLGQSVSDGVNRRIQSLDFTRGRLAPGAKNAARDATLRFYALKQRLEAKSPQRALGDRREAIVRLRSQLESLGRHALDPARQRVRVLQTKLYAYDPQATLSRGYAIVTCDGRPVRDASAVPLGSVVEARVQHGRLGARVERTQGDG